jgi:hypothetical protein
MAPRAVYAEGPGCKTPIRQARAFAFSSFCAEHSSTAFIAAVASTLWSVRMTLTVALSPVSSTYPGSSLKTSAARLGGSAVSPHLRRREA